MDDGDGGCRWVEDILREEARRMCEVALESTEKLYLATNTTDDLHRVRINLRKKGREVISTHGFLYASDSQAMISHSTNFESLRHRHSAEHQIGAEISACDARNVKNALGSLDELHRCSERRLSNLVEVGIGSFDRAVTSVSSRLEAHRALIQKTMDAAPLLDDVCHAHFSALKDYYLTAMRKLHEQKEGRADQWREMHAQAHRWTTERMRNFPEQNAQVYSDKRASAHEQVSQRLQQFADRMFELGSACDCPAAAIGDSNAYSESLCGATNSFRRSCTETLRVSRAAAEWRRRIISSHEAWLADTEAELLAQCEATIGERSQALLELLAERSELRLRLIKARHTTAGELTHVAPAANTRFIGDAVFLSGQNRGGAGTSLANAARQAGRSEEELVELLLRIAATA